MGTEHANCGSVGLHVTQPQHSAKKYSVGQNLLCNESTNYITSIPEKSTLQQLGLCDDKLQSIIETNSEAKLVLKKMLKIERKNYSKFKAAAILPSTAIYPQRLFCRELFVIGQS